MNRRSFLGIVLATATAPAIVRADSLMRIVPRGMLVAEPFGLAAAQVEGAPIIMSGSLEGSAMARLLWPGVSAHWNQGYTDPKAWELYESGA